MKIAFLLSMPVFLSNTLRFPPAEGCLIKRSQRDGRSTCNEGEGGEAARVSLKYSPSAP